MTVWDSLVGQDRALRGLKAAVNDAAAILRGEPGPAMTHAWLVTGPPGSGRSNAGLAFAAALQCERGGCGECHECQTSLAGSHADVSVYRPRGAQTYLIDDMRDMVLEAARMPSRGRWRVLIVEEADRFGIHGSSYRSAGALLKAIEEPTPRTVWVLSAPTSADTPATIGSRCRHVALVAPSSRAVADLLVREDGIDPAMAAFAAAASQGHVGRARGLARDEAARVRRAEVVAVPLQTATVGGCLTAAANLVDAAKEDAEGSNGQREEAELEALQQEYGLVPGVAALWGPRARSRSSRTARSDDGRARPATPSTGRSSTSSPSTATSSSCRQVPRSRWSTPTGTATSRPSPLPALRRRPCAGSTP